MANFIRSINDVTILDFGAFAGLVLIVVDSSWLAFFIYMAIFIGFHLEKRFGVIGRKLSSKTKNANDIKDEAKVKEIKVSDNLEEAEDISKGEERKESQKAVESAAVDSDDVVDADCSGKMSEDCVAKGKGEEIKHEDASPQEERVETKVDESMLSKVENLLSRSSSSSKSSVSSAESEDHKEDFVKVSAELRSDEGDNLPDERLEKIPDKLIEADEESTKRLQKLYEDADETVSNKLIDISDDLPTPQKDDQIVNVCFEKKEHATAKFQDSTSESHSQESSLERSVNLDSIPHQGGPEVNDDAEDRSPSSSFGTEQAVFSRTTVVETKEIKVSLEHPEKGEITSVKGEIHLSDQESKEAVTDVYWQRSESEHVVTESESNISVTNQSKFVNVEDESNALFEPEKGGSSSKAPDQTEKSSEEEKDHKESY